MERYQFLTSKLTLEYLQPMILDYHAQVLPVLFASLSETDDRALEGSLLAVESFAESLQRKKKRVKDG